MDFAISTYATFVGVRRLRRFRPRHARSGSLFGGGSSGIDQNTTWIWGRDGANWTHLPIAESPPAREAAGMAYDRALRRTILFGGQDNNGYFNDTWELIP